MANDKVCIIANWKMYLGEMTKDHLRDLNLQSQDKNVELILCPSYVQLSHYKRLCDELALENIFIGSQDAYLGSEGAYTGEVSSFMLKKIGCQFVILGHSERRRHFSEKNTLIFEKCKNVKLFEMMPILCFGETREVRDSGNVEVCITEQLASILNKIEGSLCLAYEPVWAIGMSVAATEKDIQPVYEQIKKLRQLRIDKGLCGDISFFYGGSVNSLNIKSILSWEGIQGVLVGRAGVKYDSLRDLLDKI